MRKDDMENNITNEQNAVYETKSSDTKKKSRGLSRKQTVAIAVIVVLYVLANVQDILILF